MANNPQPFRGGQRPAPPGDNIPVLVGPGEYILNAEAVRLAGGPQALDRLNAAGLQARQGGDQAPQPGGLPGFADGGVPEPLTTGGAGAINRPMSGGTMGLSAGQAASIAMGNGPAGGFGIGRSNPGLSSPAPNPTMGNSNPGFGNARPMGPREAVSMAGTGSAAPMNANAPAFSSGAPAPTPHQATARTSYFDDPSYRSRAVQDDIEWSRHTDSHILNPGQTMMDTLPGFANGGMAEPRTYPVTPSPAVTKTYQWETPAKPQPAAGAGAPSMTTSPGATSYAPIGNEIEFQGKPAVNAPGWGVARPGDAMPPQWETPTANDTRYADARRPTWTEPAYAKHPGATPPEAIYGKPPPVEPFAQPAAQRLAGGAARVVGGIAGEVLARAPALQLAGQLTDSMRRPGGALDPIYAATAQGALSQSPIPIPKGFGAKPTYDSMMGEAYDSEARAKAQKQTPPTAAAAASAGGSMVQKPAPFGPKFESLDAPIKVPGAYEQDKSGEQKQTAAPASTDAAAANAKPAGYAQDQKMGIRYDADSAGNVSKSILGQQVPMTRQLGTVPHYKGAPRAAGQGYGIQMPQAPQLPEAPNSWSLKNAARNASIGMDRRADEREYQRLLAQQQAALGAQVQAAAEGVKGGYGIAQQAAQNQGAMYAADAAAAGHAAAARTAGQAALDKAWIDADGRVRAAEAKAGAGGKGFGIIESDVPTGGENLKTGEKDTMRLGQAYDKGTGKQRYTMQGWGLAAPALKDAVKAGYKSRHSGWFSDNPVSGYFDENSPEALDLVQQGMGAQWNALGPQYQLPPNPQLTHPEVVITAQGPMFRGAPLTWDVASQQWMYPEGQTR